MRTRLILLLVLCSGMTVHPQDVPLEYQVKAVYLFNFVRFVEWPEPVASGPWTICVAGTNPFGDLLRETLQGEVVNDHPLITRVISRPDPDCHIIFMPRGAPTSAYLKALEGSPTLTVGESPGFLRDGGIINFIVEEGKVRFQIDPEAADRADLRISSHLMRLSRAPGRRG